MTEAQNGQAPHIKLSVRAGSSRKLLTRKAEEKRGETEDLQGVESAVETCFPTTPVGDVVFDATVATQGLAHSGAAEGADAALSAEITTPFAPIVGNGLGGPTSGSPSPPQTAAAALPVPPATWSAEDESALQALLTRRKAAGYQRRGRDVSGHLIRTGDIKPNPNTIVAVIVGIVTEHGGSISRADLVAAMATVSFPHPKAQPTDKGWCQGYVAGAIRNGFLAMDEVAPALPTIAA